jgi:phosphoadenosine phosphosulfate reductase
MPLDGAGPGLTATLNRIYADRPAEDVLADAITRAFPGRIALVSSFGADSAALLGLVAGIDPATPVLFLETGMLFPETLAYQRDLAARLGLRDVRLIRPSTAAKVAGDPDGTLHQRDPDACCALRKSAPLEDALEGFDAWITGRKRHQGAERAEMALFEEDAGGRVKVNPLANWSPQDVRSYMTDRDLPLHPLVTRGYRSIGCAPCTTPTEAHEDARAGRWRGKAKSECGIHLVDGKWVRLGGETAA